MTKDQALRLVGWTTALVLVVTLMALLGQVMPGRWSVAFWAMIGVVFGAELLGKTVFKRQIAQHRALETALDVVSMAVAVIACYAFTRHFYSGIP